MTPVDTSPHDDQADARLRDFKRLVELAGPHLPAGHSGPVTDAFPFMTPAACAEVEAILDRVSDVTEDPERTRRRREALLRLAFMEATALDLLEKGQPRIRNGKVMYDPETGQPIRNRTIDRSARALLRKIRQERSQWTGLPAPEDDETPG